MAKKDEIIEIIHMLIAAYPNRDIPDETIFIYTEMLKDLETRPLRDAVLTHIKTEKWFPTIAEIREGTDQKIKYNSLDGKYLGSKETFRLKNGKI